ncbi:MAG: hypothetical protein HOW73_49155 [Polyangiaceae bacterium]|nr:hypothetical protein [Polyangiaceae bacterium]
MNEPRRLNNAQLEAEERKGYVYVRFHGEIQTVSDVERAIGFLRERMDLAGTKKLHLDMRQFKVPMADEACQAAWQYIHAREYTILACTLPEDTGDMMVTRMNMTGLAASLPFRAFSNIVDAHRWLELRPSGIQQRPSTMSMPVPSMSQQMAAVRAAASGTNGGNAPTTPPPPSPRKKPPSIPPTR